MHHLHQVNGTKEAIAWARSFTGPGLWARMTGSFGYLTKAGYQGQRFPVVFGETGSFFTTVPPCTQAECSCWGRDRASSCAPMVVLSL